jgi:proline iminopeptidase
MPTTTVNGTSLYYDALGAGPACLVMHGGLGIDHTFFRPLLDRLASRVRLVYYDHRCNGRSGRPSLDTLTMAQLAADADALAGRLGTGQVIALGMSFGGFVAQELALRHPGRVAGLVLIGTTPCQLGSEENPDDDQGPAPPAELARHMQHPPPMDEEGFAAMMRGFTSYLVHQADPADLAPMLARTIYSAGAWRRSMEVLAGWSSVDRLGELRVPALVIAGRHDVLSSPQQAYRIGHRIGGAEAVVFEHSGHAVMYDEPDRFFSVVEDWLDRRAKEAADV